MRGTLKISLKDHVIKARDEFTYPLTKKFFNLYVLLALERIEQNKDNGGFVGVGHIRELPFWEKNKDLSIGKQIRRHVIEMEEIGRNIIEYHQKIKGPYRLGLKPYQISFDEDIKGVKSYLGLTSFTISMLGDSDETFYEYVQNIWEGDVAFNEGELDEALIRFEKAASEGISLENIVTALHRIGRVLERLGKYQEAETIYERVNQMINSESKFNYLLLSENYMYHGWICYRQYKIEEAEEKYHKALDLIRGKAHYRLLGDIFTGFGKIFEFREDYKRAEKSYQRALGTWVPISYFYGIQACYYNIGNLYKVWADKDLRRKQGKFSSYAKEKYEKAIRWAKECIMLCNRTNVGDETSLDRILIAYCYFRLKNYPRALSYAMEAKEMAENSGNLRDLALSCKGLGKLYWDSGDTKKAHELLKESIAYYQELNDIDEIQDIKKEFGLES